MDFRLKPTHFLGRAVVIICQNENGPCPLIAIANILTLRGKISISTDRSFISLDEVIQLVADEIFKSLESSSSVQVGDDGDAVASVHKNQTMQDVLNVLPKLARGLDLNVGFTSVTKHEFTEEISIFDSLSIPLVHGWLCDPSDVATFEVIGDMSYNHLINKMVDYRSLVESDPAPTPTSDSEQLLLAGPLIESFLAQTANQLTYTGLVRLYEFMNDRQLAVLFRNNHFSTLFAFNGQLFLLMTDLGYLRQPAVVWELLDGVDGKSEFHNEAFVPLSELPLIMEETPQPSPRYEGPLAEEGTIARPPAAPVAEPIDVSLLLAMQLQQEEEDLYLRDTPPNMSPSTAAPQRDASHAPASDAKQQGSEAYSQSSSKQATTTTQSRVRDAPELSPDLNLSQEELDQQLAMAYYWEEKQKLDQATSGPPPAQQPQSNSRQQPSGPTSSTPRGNARANRASSGQSSASCQIC